MGAVLGRGLPESPCCYLTMPEHWQLPLLRTAPQATSSGAAAPGRSRKPKSEAGVDERAYVLLFLSHSASLELCTRHCAMAGAQLHRPPAGCRCEDRIPGAPGCCYLKEATGWAKQDAPGMISGVATVNAASIPSAVCTTETGYDLLGGDIKTTGEFALRLACGSAAAGDRMACRVACADLGTGRPPLLSLPSTTPPRHCCSLSS